MNSVLWVHIALALEVQSDGFFLLLNEVKSLEKMDERITSDSGLEDDVHCEKFDDLVCKIRFCRL